MFNCHLLCMRHVLCSGEASCHIWQQSIPLLDNNVSINKKEADAEKVKCSVLFAALISVVLSIRRQKNSCLMLCRFFSITFLRNCCLSLALNYSLCICVSLCNSIVFQSLLNLGNTCEPVILCSLFTTFEDSKILC